MKNYVAMQINDIESKGGIKGRYHKNGFSNNGIIVFPHIKYQKSMAPGIVEVADVVEKQKGDSVYGFVKGVNVHVDKRIDIDNLSIENLISLSAVGRIKYFGVYDGNECIVIGNSDPISGIEYIAFMLNGRFIFTRKYPNMKVTFIKHMTAFNREILPKKFITNVAIAKHHSYSLQELELAAFPTIRENLHKIIWKKINGHKVVKNGFIALYAASPEDKEADMKLYEEVLQYNDTTLKIFKDKVNTFRKIGINKVKSALSFYGLEIE